MPPTRQRQTSFEKNCLLRRHFSHVVTYVVRETRQKKVFGYPQRRNCKKDGQKVNLNGSFISYFFTKKRSPSKPNCTPCSFSLIPTTMTCVFEPVLRVISAIPYIICRECERCCYFYYCVLQSQLRSAAVPNHNHNEYDFTRYSHCLNSNSLSVFIIAYTYP